LTQCERGIKQFHIRLAQAVASGLNASEVYRQVSGNSKNANVHSDEWMKCRGMAERIAELRAENDRKSELSRDEALQWLSDLIRTPIGLLFERILFLGNSEGGAPVLPDGVFRWQSFRSFSLKACDIAFKCLTGSSMVFAILCSLSDASIRVTAKKISPFSALSLNTPTHAFPKASLISAPLAPIKTPATRLDCPEEGLFNPNVSNAAQTFS
jgi:hypothetical protein